jgi:hypothetical protein
MKDHIYVIVRLDDDRLQGERPEHFIATPKAYGTAAEAEEEAKRLNELNRPKGAQYFVSLSRLLRP